MIYTLGLGNMAQWEWFYGLSMRGRIILVGVVLACVAFVAGSMIHHRYEMKVNASKDFLAECVKDKTPEACETLIEASEDDCFDANYSGGGKFTPAGIHNIEYAACLHAGHGVWKSERAQRKRAERAREQKIHKQQKEIIR